MTTPSAETPHDQHLQALRLLQKIRNFEGEPAEFWKMLFETLMLLAKARAGAVFLRTGDDQRQGEWKTLAVAPEGTVSRRLVEMVPAMAKACGQNGFGYAPDRNAGLIAVNLLVDVDVQKCIALFAVEEIDKNEAMARINLLMSANDIPAQYRVQKSAYTALQNQGHLTDILDLLTLINTQRRFVAAGMTLVNELAARYACDRVSLGWLQNKYVRVRVMSHTDQFEKKMEAVAQLELAMEEALDQDADIVIPAPESHTAITRDHDAYAKAQDVTHMATLPLRLEARVIGLVSFERAAPAFTSHELRHLRVSLDQITTRLAEIKKRDRWFGARLAGWMRDGAGKLVGYEHAWAKLFGILGGAALIVVCLIPVRYRVDSPMILRTDDISYITAPFDGYIDSVGTRPGEMVGAQKVLLSLDNKDLLLEEASMIAEKNRESREVEKARAEGALADMCIAQARFDQVSAKLDIVRYKLSQAAIVSPYDGVVIEGDQQEKIGSPVKQGEVLFKIGRIKDIYAEAKVSEAEIHNVKQAVTGQIALASRPQEPFDVTVTLVEPSAVVTAKDNVFLVRCAFKQVVPSWFRPGMTGISKINAGRKTLLWIVSHRTIDFLRLKLWF